ncbi:Protein of unknown function (DUF2491) [Thiovulum sp. ES]|nr:Protein of unknown function (DUF2491) [Thiovulum sp. ES]
MRFISLLFIIFILSGEVEAKKRNFWTQNEKTSFKSKNKIQKQNLVVGGITADSFEDYKIKIRNHQISDDFHPFILISIFLVIIGAIFYISLNKKREFKNSTKSPKEFPLDLRVGGIVDVSSIQKRLLLNKKRLQMKIPQNLKGYVQSVGFIELDDEMQIFNVDVSENIDDKEPQFSLQVEVVKKDISAVKLFTNYGNIYPKNIAEWEEWIDGNEEKQPNIGGTEFITQTGINYHRVWNSGSDEVVRSKFIEKIINNIDEEKDVVSITSLYSREIENEIEYLSVSNIEDSEMNNFIQIRLGIVIRENELEIV